MELLPPLNSGAFCGALSDNDSGRSLRTRPLSRFQCRPRCRLSEGLIDPYAQFPTHRRRLFETVERRSDRGTIRPPQFEQVSRFQPCIVHRCRTGSNGRDGPGIQWEDRGGEVGLVAEPTIQKALRF
jgi:hypothetical protein